MSAGASPSPRPARTVRGPAILALLPHRFPFLMVDQILDYEPGSWIEGVKNVAGAEPLLTEPGATSLDPEFAIEIIGQLGIALFNLTHTRERPANILLGSISGVRYLAPIPLGAQVFARAEVTKSIGGVFMLSGVARVEGRELLRIETVVVTESEGSPT